MTSFVEPLFARMTSNEKDQPQPSIFTPSPFLIHRAFDVRRVHNSSSELRLSMDLPGAQRENLAVSLQRRESDGNRPDSSSVSIRGVLNGESFFKTLDLPSKALDFAKVQAKLTNGVLEIIAPKTEGAVVGSQDAKIPVL